MTRQVEPELLDELAPDHLGAAGSRKDLVRLNRLMLNGRTMAQTLRWALTRPEKFGLPPLGGRQWGFVKREESAEPPKGGTPNEAERRIIDLGGGDGRFMLGVARRLGTKWRGTKLTLLDRHDVLRAETRAGFAALEWEIEMLTGEVLEWVEQPASLDALASDGKKGSPLFDAVVANLFLHHFSEAQLLKMFAGLSAQTNLVVAVEPQRSWMALALSKSVGLIGCNYVTRHDAVTSVQAGFAGQELSRLWPAAQGWQFQEHPVGVCAHLFVAQRSSPIRHHALVTPKSDEGGSRITHHTS